jgi:hypothetical protein
MKKYIVNDLTEGLTFTNQTHTKTEQELREWAEEIRQNEGLQDVTPDYTEKEWTQDHDLYDEYVKDIDECIEFLEGYDWEIVEETTNNTYDSVPNYRKIKFKYIPSTNHRGSRISVYEKARWNRDKTRRIYLSNSNEYNTIDEQVFNYLKNKGFNVVGKSYENEYGLFFVDNWGEEFIDLK